MLKVQSIPFIGSKRNEVKQIYEIAKDYTKVIEPFGGSCVISANLKANGIPVCIANDYDRLFDNFDEIIEAKETVVNKLFELGFTKSKKLLPDHQKKQLREICKDYPPYVLRYLSANFMFSGRRTQYLGEDVNHFSYFCNHTDVEREREYLKLIDDIQLDSLDYKDFIDKYVDKNTLVVLDPPYLNATQKTYHNELYFGVAETIEVIQQIIEHEADFILFNTNKKDIKKLLELFDLDYVIDSRPRHIAKGITREECMVYAKAKSRATVRC